VPRGSDNTTANQLCRSLLLSDRARVDVSPNLEILTDDVQCTHGATVADLDDEMIFYLQARGLSRAQARVLILAGWARSLMDKVPSKGAVRRVSTKAAKLAEEDAEREIRKLALSSI
jgi:Fe-S cluster assembly scaffold protein SufB